MEEILKQIEELIETPFVTARFGNNWKEHTKEQFDSGEIEIENIIEVAWKQGRKAILLERELTRLIKKLKSLVRAK
jgi:hypothetical protein